jgi:cell division septum initiation protein DivIVA
MAAITYDQLARKGACSDELTRFRKRFGDRVEVTVEAAERHAKDLFASNINWLTYSLLTKHRQVEYDQVKRAARVVYNRVESTALAECNRAVNAAFAESATWARRDRVVSAAYAERNRILSAAWAACVQIYATTFARLYIEQCETE